MAKRRMNAERREELLAHIEYGVRNVTLSKLRLDATKTDTALHNAVFEAIEKLYPQSDMAVLKKYGATDPLKGESRYSRQVYFNCEKDDNGEGNRTVMVELKESIDCSLLVPASKDRHTIARGHKIFKLYDRLKELDQEWNDRTKEIMADYKALIYGARNFEDIIEIAPDLEDQADVLFPKTTAIASLSNEAIARIRRDSMIRVAG